MKMQRLGGALTAINLVLLLLLLLLTVTQARRTMGQRPTPILRGRALELVDDRGQVRSRLDVEPTGEVVLRLLDQHGTIRVKLGAGEDGSGLLLTDEATEPAIHLIARQTATSERPTTTSITVAGRGGLQRVIRP
jgi:hypothetical protein